MTGFATLRQAIPAAERRHKRTGDDVFIVLSDEMGEGPRYHLASDFDLDTWFDCNQAVYCVPNEPNY